MLASCCARRWSSLPKSSIATDRPRRKSPWDCRVSELESVHIDRDAWIGSPHFRWRPAKEWSRRGPKTPTRALDGPGMCNHFHIDRHLVAHRLSTELPSQFDLFGKPFAFNDLQRPVLCRKRWRAACTSEGCGGLDPHAFLSQDEFSCSLPGRILASEEFAPCPTSRD